MAKTRHDMTGATFGRLKVLRYDTELNNRHKWICACSCGGIVSVISGNLTSGATKSCGCLNRENASDRGKKLFIQKRLKQLKNRMRVPLKCDGGVDEDFDTS